jgi:hypothetical protein
MDINAVAFSDTLWVGRTERLENQVIDAIRYKNTVIF